MIVICAQAVKNESKQEWKHSHISIARGMISSSNAQSMQYRVFSWATIIVACVVTINVHYTISVWVESTLMMSIKVRKISTCRQVWQRKRWETSLLTCASFSKAIVVIIFEMYRGLLYVYSCKDTKANGYLDCQWYDHTNAMKDGKL